GCTADRWRPAVLLPRDRFRILEDGEGNVGEMGTRADPGRYRLGDPEVPARCDHPAFLGNTARRSRTTPGFGHPRQGSVHRCGGSEAIPRAVEVGGAVAGQKA